MLNMYDSDNKRKLMSGLCHGAIFFSPFIISIGLPLGIFFVSDDTVVRENAKESINFHINIYLYAFVFTLLIFVLIGFALLPLLLIFSWIMPAVAILKVIEEPNQPYRYPFILRLFE